MTLVLAGLAWLIGIAAGSVLSQPLLLWLALAALTLGSAALLRGNPVVRRAAVLAALFCLGGARYQLALPHYDEDFISTYNDRGEVTVEGVVVDEPDVRDTYINLRLRADSLRLPESATSLPVTGLVLVRAPRYPAFRYGDRLRVVGELETPPEFEDFSYADYLARQGVYSVLPFASVTLIAERQANAFLQRVYDFKAEALSTLEVIFPQPHAALLQGILLGVEAGIPAGLREAFNETGTSHIIAISGFNITIIAGLFARTAQRLFGRRRASWVALTGIALYTLLVGADFSVVRAALMGGLALIAGGYGRRGAGLNVLMAAAVVMTAANPLALWDVGFQLSFFATLGLLLYADPFTQAFLRLAERFTSSERAQRLAGLTGDGLVLSLAAQLTTLPLMAYYFQRVSLISFPANFLIVPAQPAVMVLGGLAMLGGLVWLPLGQALGWVAFPFVAYTIALVELLAQAPRGGVELGKFGWPWLLASYGGLFGLTWLVQQRGRYPQLNTAFLRTAQAGNIGVAGLGIVAFLSWHTAFRLNDGVLRLTAFEVGGGEAVLLETPTGRRVLIGGGPSASALGSALGQRLPLFDRRLDWIVLPSPENEHVRGLAGTIGQVRVENVLVAGEPARTSTYRHLMETLSRQGTPVHPAEAGQRLDLGEGATLEVISAVETGGVFLLRWERAAFLLPMGLDRETLEELLASRRIPPVHGLLLAGQGDPELNSEELLWAANPALVVISRAGDTLISPDLTERLQGRAVLRTDLNGWVEWTTDGKKAWVWVER